MRRKIRSILMDNSKKNVHNSGALGMLVRSGQVKKIDNEENFEVKEQLQQKNKSVGSYFRTQFGIEFNEHELIFVDPRSCEPWKYANRLKDDMGDIDELVKSIKENKQLQPALIRSHPKPYGNIEYEVIFGRRRLEACLRLNTKFLVIKKDISDVKEAIAFQEAENSSRKDVSNYSNAMLYKRLIEDGIFKNEREISDKLGTSVSKIYDIMAYCRIPEEMIKAIPEIHQLSNNMAIKIASIFKELPEKLAQLVSVAPEIGKTITSPAKLERSLRLFDKVEKANYGERAKSYKSVDGKKLFTFRINHRGTPCFEINKELNLSINYDSLCQNLKILLEKKSIKEDT